MGDKEGGKGGLQNPAEGNADRERRNSPKPSHLWSDSDKTILSDTIRDRVVKRLNDMHEGDDARTATEELARLRMEQVHRRYKDLPKYRRAIEYSADLKLALLHPDPKHNRKLSERLIADGIPILTASCVLFGPIAAELGDMWCEDEVDFIQVAVASSRLSIMVSHMARDRREQVSAEKRDRTILLARTAGTNHTLGLAIVAACFQDAGWEVAGGPELEAGDTLFSELSQNPYRLLGLSVGTTDEADACAITLQKAKKHSRNPTLRTALGGPAIAAAPKAFERVGANLIVASAKDAVEGAERIIR